MTTERVHIEVSESGAKTVKRSFDDIAESAQRGEKSLGGLNGGLSGTSQASAFLVGSLKALAAAFAALRIGSFVNEASQLSQRYNELGIVLNIVGKNAGLMKSEVDATTEAVRKQGISMIESRQIVTRMIQSQIDLSKATELARLAQDAAVIGQINSSEALDRLVFGITSAQVEVLRGIGINVSFEQSYTKLAKEIGVTQNALTEQQKLQARLNVVLDEASKITGVYEGAMENAGKQMRSTQRLVEDLKVKVGGLFDQTSIFAVTAYTNSLKDADAQVDAFTQTGQIKAWGDAIARTAAFAADSVRSVGIVFDITGKGIGALAAQAVAISKLDFKGAAAIRESFSGDFDAAIGSMSKMRDLVESQIVQRDMLTKTYERESSALRSNTGELNNNTGAVKSNGSERARFLESLQDEVASIGKNEFALKRMQAAKFGVANAAEPLIATLEQENKRINQQEIAVTALVSDLNKYKQITESVMTEQEKFNAQVEELNRLRNLKNGAAISEETYARALKKARDELDGTTSSTRTATDQISQMWIQAGRNIQSSLGNLVFDFFNGGLDNMVKNAGNAVLRIMSEFAGLKIAQTIGLTSLFTAGTAAASTGAAAGGGMSLLSGASLAANGLSLFKSGFGATSLLSGVGGMLPGSAGAFFSGIGGGAIPGVSSSAALAGGSFGAMLGPVAALAGVDVIGRMLAGDKKLGGAEMIPVIGGFLAAMFGRGPYKFRQQSLQGTVSPSGFDGDLTNVFRSKGGLFMGNKHKSVTEQLAPEMQMLFDSTIGGFFQAASAATANLGLDAKLVENFSKEIQIKSEKGQKLTEEAITKMLQGISDDVAKAALPVVDEFKKIGETSIQTLSRLSNEFTVLTGAAGLLFNKSAEWSKGFVSSFGFGDRSAFLDKAGGADAFAAMVSGFAQNFLTEDQRMRPVIESLVSQRDALGLSNINTRQQVTDAVQSGRLNVDQLLFLFKNQEAINQVFVYLDNIAKASPSAAQGLAAVSRELRITDADSTDYGRRLNKSIQDTTSAIAELEGIAKQLMGTVNQINPLSINEARGIVSSGNANDPRLQSALSTLSGMGADGFGSLIDFQRAKAQNVAAISSLQDSIAGQISTKNSELDQFNFEKLMFQSALQRAAQMYSEAASFDVGGYVPRTGMAIIHKDEQILTPGQQDKITAEIAQMREELGRALAIIAKHTEKTATLIDDVSAGGTAMLTEAA